MTINKHVGLTKIATALTLGAALLTGCDSGPKKLGSQAVHIGSVEYTANIYQLSKGIQVDINRGKPGNEYLVSQIYDWNGDDRIDCIAGDILNGRPFDPDGTTPEYAIRDIREGVEPLIWAYKPRH